MNLVAAFGCGMLVGAVFVYVLLAPAANRVINALMASNERTEKKLREISARFAGPSACLGGDCCFDRPQEREV